MNFQKVTLATLLALGTAVTAAHAQTMITINNGSEPETIDPQLSSGVPESNLERQLFEGLVSTDAKGKVVPAVATSWETKDNKVWIFHLRPEAKWSNGEPVTAQDFVYAWQRLANPKVASPYASYTADDMHLLNAEDILAGKKPVTDLGVKALDPHTLQVTLSDKVPYFPAVVALPSTYPVLKSVVEKYGDKWTQPANIVSNGAYVLKDWVVNSKIDMVRNPKYWNNAHTKIDEVRFLEIPNATDDVNRYLAGEEDVTADSLPPELMGKLKADHGAELKISPKLCTYYYVFNTKKAPFNNVNVRRALNLALNRHIITDKILKQGQKPAYELTPYYIDYFKAYTPDWAKWPMAKRLATAKKMLADAGYGPNNPLTFQLLYNTSEGHKRLAVALAAILKRDLGAKVSLINQEWKTYLQTRRDGNYQLARAGWCADYNAAPTFLNILATGNSNNDGGYSNPQYDKALADALEPGLTAEQREDLYQKASKISVDDAALLPVYLYVSPRLIKTRVQGWSDQDPLDFFSVKDLSIKK